MNTFMKNWDYRMILDYGAYMSKDAKSFLTAFKNMLKRELSKEGIEVVSFHPNHYAFSAFLEKDGRHIYISYSIPRGDYVHFDSSGCVDGVLYRTAKSIKDYTGGANNFCSIEQLPRKIIEMFNNYDRYN